MEWPQVFALLLGPHVPWNHPTILTISRLYPLADPKCGRFPHVSCYVARNTFPSCWKPRCARCHHFFHTYASPCGRAQVHWTPAMMIQPLAKAFGQVLSAAAAPGSTYCSSLKDQGLSMPNALVCVTTSSTNKVSQKTRDAGKPEARAHNFQFACHQLTLQEKIFFTAPQSLTLKQKGKEKNKTHSSTAIMRRRHFVPCLGTLTQGDGKRKAEQ